MGLGIKTKIRNTYNSYIVKKISQKQISEIGIEKNSKREKKIIVSLTSYPARMNKIHLCIKSLLCQTLKPDMIILYLGEDTKESDLTPELKELEKFGLTIKMNYENIKPHKKYYYAFKEYPNDIVITVDDDVIYDNDLVETLFASYLKHPNCVSARRAHKMLFDSKNELISYNDWLFECQEYNVESLSYFATGIGGILYPPGLLNEKWSDIEKLKSLCLNADDVWLKFMQILNNIPVVIVKSKHPHPIPIEVEQESALNMDNVFNNANDRYIDCLAKEFSVNIFDVLNK